MAQLLYLGPISQAVIEYIIQIFEITGTSFMENSYQN